MIRVLHLLGVDADYQAHTGARQLAADEKSGLIDAHIRTIGRGGDDPSALRAIIGMRRTSGETDIIHAWGQRALIVAAVGTGAPIVYSPDRFPNRNAIRLVRAVMAAREVHVVAPTDTMRRAFVTRGVPAQRCHLIRPGVEFARINRRRDPKLRMKLGIGADEYVLLASGESTREANHGLAVWAASILHVLDPKYRLLVWGRGPLTAQLERFARGTRQFNLVAVAERALRRTVAFEELLGAADAVLVTATRPAPALPVAIAMAAGLPIVAVVSETMAEMLEDRHTALMIGQPKPRVLAQRILDLRGDPGLQWSISDMARTEAYEYFALTRFLNQHRAMYRQIAAAQPVEIPRPAPGAGLRFHGRA